MVMLKIPQPTGPNLWGARLAWLLPGGFRWVPLLPSKPSGSLGHLAMLGGHDWTKCGFWVVGGASDAWVSQSLGEVDKNAVRCESYAHGTSQDWDLVSLLHPLSRVRHVMFDVVPACGFRTQLKMISLDQGIFCCAVYLIKLYSQYIHLLQYTSKHFTIPCYPISRPTRALLTFISFRQLCFHGCLKAIWEQDLSSRMPKNIPTTKSPEFQQ